MSEQQRPLADSTERYDAIIIGAGTSGLNVARELSRAGWNCLGLEAGTRYNRHTYPTKEAYGSSQMYWGGGIELNTEASLAILRPKVVGGGSILNQALMDRFDEVAFSSWRDKSGVTFLNEDDLDPYYTRAEGNMALQTVPEDNRNKNAEFFAKGFEANGYEYAPLRRAQADCHFEHGNCCIECLSGCRIDSKQSTAVTALPVAEAYGFTLQDRTEVRTIRERSDHVEVTAVVGGPLDKQQTVTYTATRVVLASGAIGNSALLLRSGYGRRLPALGRHFYSHPQYMNVGIYDAPVRAFEGPLQNYKSNDPGFRRQGYKLENVFAGPASIALLMPGFGADHQHVMDQYENMGCVEVCIRDTNPGQITISRKGQPIIKKSLNKEDQRRVKAGKDAIRNLFHSTGAREIIEGEMGIGLHLMGGLCIGTSQTRSVVNPGFQLHGSKRIFAADSSIFPNAPGINPALTIMSLSLMASEVILAES
ncbi:GMC family oxidoreductase [Corynebacterium sp. 320]|uniref:FAD-dependent oxidoreductase n=1 Tax=Corynebacterium TaxID=1716 RepID=UPI00125CBE30|nr:MULTISPECIES: GMC family oxidoreductase [Corynebacterium]KAB1502791.1 GMC family oxidoreductase [Corynebacterium sp. 320]KAB1550468.1 GMC family oxidoreductase [Corynebacterium sp. 319]KAB1554801.1 GMC family oxidoreductase [Corynebacterium sp. 321]KAB3526454.1 GMC family oxidoreductase [Corynebacterium sp. 250]KAB3539773.1 GMC family oxidoreductase [Corynebacterium sp. 366]